MKKSEGKFVKVLCYVATFVVGAGIGFFASEITAKKGMQLSDAQCAVVQEKIIENAKCYSAFCTEHLKELYAIYRNDCAGRIIPEEIYEMRSCAQMEKIIKKRFDASKETSSSYRDHISLASYFVKLAVHACPEHVEMYNNLAWREIEIVGALTSVEYMDMADKQELNRVLKTLGENKK